MSTTTDKLLLIKPSLDDPADITQMNENWDKLDEHTHDVSELLGVLSTASGGTGANTVSQARKNLGAQSQITCGVNEPTGGSDGDVYIQIIG